MVTVSGLWPQSQDRRLSYTPPHGVGVLQAGEWDGVHLTISVLPFYFSSLIPAHLLYSLLPPD